MQAISAGFAGETSLWGTGAAACRYLESDRSRADDYYLEGGTALAAFTVTDGCGEVLATSELDAAAYAGWVDGIDPLTETSMGKPRLPGEEGTALRGSPRFATVRHGSPRFAEMVVNTPKSLSLAAAMRPDVSDALDAAQADAVTEIRRFLALHSVTRVGPRGRQEVVPVERPCSSSKERSGHSAPSSWLRTQDLPRCWIVTASRWTP